MFLEKDHNDLGNISVQANPSGWAFSASYKEVSFWQELLVLIIFSWGWHFSINRNKISNFKALEHIEKDRSRQVEVAKIGLSSWKTLTFLYAFCISSGLGAGGPGEIEVEPCCDHPSWLYRTHPTEAAFPSRQAAFDPEARTNFYCSVCHRYVN